jgi:AcrR family transcriptional regulator
MPRTRIDVDRDSKVAEIVEAAESALLAGGYEALSHTAIAREVGLARAAVYWYFPAKDDLFVAALGQLLARSLEKPPRTADYRRRITWAVERLAGLQQLMGALHDRARHSPAAAALQAELEQQLCARLRTALAPHVPPEQVDAVADTLVVFIDGLLARPRSKKQRANLLTNAIDALVGTAPS